MALQTEVWGARRNAQGRIATALTADQVRDAVDALHALKSGGYEITLSEVVSDYKKRHPKTETQYTLDAVIQLKLDTMKRLNRRPESIVSTRKVLSHLSARFGSREYSDLSADELKAMVSDWQVSHRTLCNRTREIVTLFKYAKKDLKLSSPLPDGFKIESPSTDEEPAVVMKPKDVERFMRWVEAHKPARHVVGYALMFFAGVRPNGEVTRLTWADIRLDEPNRIGGRGVIQLRGVHGKTRGIRKIPVSDNLHAWLTKYQSEGKLSPSYSVLSATRQEACKALGIDWHMDVARHTFATASTELHGEHYTVAWLGHGDKLATFKRHYEGILTRHEAQAFFKIEPIPTEGAKVIRLEGVA